MKRSDFVFNIFFASATLAYCAQYFIDFSIINLIAATVVFISSLITLGYLRWSKAFISYPLSSFTIFGFLITSQLGAMIAQFILGSSLTKDLRQPLDTFLTLFAFQMVAIIAHSFYRVLANGRKDVAVQKKAGIIRHLFQYMGLYATPPVAQIWIMGVIGLLSLVITKSGADAGNKVANGLQFIAWAPFLIPIYVMRFGKSYCNAKLHFSLLVIHFLAIAGFSMAVNAKGMMMTGIITVLLIFLLYYFQSQREMTKQETGRILMVLILGVLLFIPAKDVIDAMQIARSRLSIAKAGPQKILEETIYSYHNQDLYEKYKLIGLKEKLHTGYDEVYIDNPLLSRFVETKFHDNTLYFAGMLDERGIQDLGKITLDFFWYGLPEPILKLLKIDVDKGEMQYSMGDFIVHEAIGTPLAGYRTGSVFGQGIGLFGYAFIVLYLFLCMIIFLIKDLLTYKSGSGEVFVSVLGLLLIWPTFLYGITAESLHYLVIGIFRGFLQSIILYSMIYYFSKFTTNIIASFATLEIKTKL